MSLLPYHKGNKTKFTNLLFLLILKSRLICISEPTGTKSAERALWLSSIALSYLLFLNYLPIMRIFV